MRFFFLATGLAALLCGCTIDSRKDVAYGLLFKPNGFEDDRAFSAAVAARFPAGANVAELQRFAASVGGDCRRDPDRLKCEIATRARFCQVRLIRITALTDGDVIHSTEFTSLGGGC